MFFIYFHFNIILHFILKFTLFFYHSFYYGFILTDFIAVTSEQNVFVAPQLDFFCWSSMAVALNFAENRPQGAWRRSAYLWCSRFDFYVILQRCIQSLVKHRTGSFFVKGVSDSWLFTVFAKNLLLGILSSEWTFVVF